MWAVVRRDPAGGAAAPTTPATPTTTAVAEFEDVIAALPGAAELRGIYDVSALKADADLLFWLHGPTAEGLQAAWRALRGTRLLADTAPTWNAMGLHREAEFSRDHVPAFVRGVEPRGWLCVYPFVRSREWYLLPAEERRAMLAEHGRAGAGFQVLTNTVAAFALGDYEWVVPLEADDPAELVDLMRALRYVGARRHVVLETPFFTGRRIAAAEAAEVLG
nr:hydrogen peroxide-dependent heme synthase [Pseudactinotalea sp. HY160]